ncbi:hypothetical protein Ocin01_08906 [Orchesella cincta]|uniref:Uncharacterized protein n=1 Tax=Orchesella cincta TaxID=48709 RepID=A0A1D2MXJ9_ORCCI|nr:hypothetical protein Ocin01_08906 [Orchesella cincta]
MASVSRDQLQEKLDELKFKKADEENSSNHDSKADDNTSIEDNSTSPQQKLLEYIEALKFDPDLTPPVEKESTVSVVAEILGEKSDKDMMNKSGKRGTKSKSKVMPTNSKTSTGVGQIDPNYYGSYLQSQAPQMFPPPPIARSSSSKKVVKRSYTKVIREWGKRPMLVESEAPWTPRNQLYLRAVKTFGKPPQQGGHNNNFPPPMQQVITREERSVRVPRGYPPNAVPIFPNSSRNAASIWNPPYLATTPAPVVTRISPQPYDTQGGRQLAVAVDSPYQYQELVVPFQPPHPQPVLFGHLNSNGLWMPLIQQQQHFQFQQPRLQTNVQVLTRTGSYSNNAGESTGSDTEGPT